MTNIIPTQQRCVDPFSSYNSNIINKLTRMVTQGENCLHSPSAIDVTLDSTSATTVIVGPGQCYKDDVIIKFDSDFLVDMSNSDFYVDNVAPFNVAGYYYIVLEYNYVKSKPAPQASIRILKPDQPDQRSFISSGDFLLLKVVKVTFNGVIFEVDSVYNYDPDNPIVERKYTKFYIGLENTLPIFQSSDKGRIIYTLDDNEIYYGTDTEFRRLTDLKYTYDTSPCTIGQLAYFESDEKVHPAISSSVNTYAQCFVYSTNKIEISGLCTINIESGKTIVVGDEVYLSGSEEGTITNVEPTNSQMIGVCVSGGTSTCVVLVSGLGSGVKQDISQIPVNTNNIKQVATDIFGTGYVLSQSTSGSTRTIGQFADYATSVNLAPYRTWFTSNAGGTIFNFSGGLKDDIRYIIFINSVTTIRNNININLSSGNDLTGKPGQILTLIFDGEVWRELSNSSGVGSGGSGSTNKVTKIITDDDLSLSGEGSLLDIDLSYFANLNVIMNCFYDNDEEFEPTSELLYNTNEAFLQINTDSTSVIKVTVSDTDLIKNISVSDWVLSNGLYYVDLDYAEIDLGTIDSTSAILTCYDKTTNRKIIPYEIEITGIHTIRIWMTTNILSLKILIIVANFITKINTGDWVHSGNSYYKNIDIGSIDSTALVTCFYNYDSNYHVIPEKIILLNPTTLQIWVSTNTINLVVLINSTNNTFQYIPLNSGSSPPLPYFASINISDIKSEDVVVTCYNNVTKKVVLSDSTNIEVEIIDASHIKLWLLSNLIPIKVVIVG